MGHIHGHGDANVQQKLEAVRVREERVPDGDDVRERELATEQQREPPERVVLGKAASFALW